MSKNKKKSKSHRKKNKSDASPGNGKTKADKKGLFDLPAELRNSIYELALEPTNAKDTTGYIKLLEASPPRKQLLLTCRQIYQEARGIYIDKYRAFWRENKFILRKPVIPWLNVNQRAFRSAIEQRLREADLQALSAVRVIIYNPRKNDKYVSSWDLVDTRGAWLSTFEENGPPIAIEVIRGEVHEKVYPLSEAMVEIGDTEGLAALLEKGPNNSMVEQLVIFG